MQYYKQYYQNAISNIKNSFKHVKILYRPLLSQVLQHHLPYSCHFCFDFLLRLHLAKFQFFTYHDDELVLVLLSELL